LVIEDVTSTTVGWRKSIKEYEVAKKKTRPRLITGESRSGQAAVSYLRRAAMNKKLRIMAKAAVDGSGTLAGWLPAPAPDGTLPKFDRQTS
jgi:hypothetical protein